MDWQEQLIGLYLEICELYEQELCLLTQRMSNHPPPQFSDNEVATVYLWGLLSGFQEQGDIHNKSFFEAYGFGYSETPGVSVQVAQNRIRSCEFLKATFIVLQYFTQSCPQHHIFASIGLPLLELLVKLLA